MMQRTNSTEVHLHLIKQTVTFTESDYVRLHQFIWPGSDGLPSWTWWKPNQCLFLRLYFSLINRTARSCHMWVESTLSFTSVHPHPSLWTLFCRSPLCFAGLHRFRESLCAGQRSHVKPANRKQGGSLLADQGHLCAFFPQIQPDKRNAEENQNLCLTEFFLC